MKEPGDQNQGTFSSITTATFIPLTYGTTLDDLRYSKELWEKSSLNPDNPKDSRPPATPDRQYLFEHIQERQDSVLQGMEWFTQKIIVDNYLGQYKGELGKMPSSFTLDVPEKTVQYPARAMHLKASVNDDNIAIVKSLERQAGTSPEWYHSFVRLCHGDLGTQERHDATTESCAIESTPQERLQFLVTIPGGFHICMACVDAIWRVHIQPKALREVRGGIFDQFKILRPKDSSKLASNPTYRMLNDGILHLTSSHLLVCWEQATGFSDLKEFADSDPSWSEIVALSKKI
ncbi:uncharacterized protein EI90DRAFT_2919615, partial [Cantharellus anzutake]|uniref:uncharacterized protein n=1 Tax=Cantharellus anzutake TaxID=1750568 RepID=UPI001904654E